ncbi:MAG: glycosyltransferase [Eubacteriales bacterium]|nr:glycosyltransferase [Eubacteriales bacterium]
MSQNANERPGSLVRRALVFARRYGLRAVPRALDKLCLRLFYDYDRDWGRLLCPGEAELARQRSAPPPAGLISVLVPVYNTDPAMLRALVDSLLAQTYPHWEACLYDDRSPKPEIAPLLREQAQRDGRIRIFCGERNQGISGSTNSAAAEARGEWLALLDHDDLLTPDALFCLAQTIVQQQPDLIYSDEDKISEDGAHYEMPHLKPDFCPDNLRSGNYFCHFMALRRSLYEQVGGLRAAFNGSQDHDLALRCIERTQKIAHIPRVLYHWRVVGSSVSHSNIMKCVDASARAVQEHIGRIGWPGEVTYDEFGTLRLHYAIPGDPLVSVLCAQESLSPQALRAFGRRRVEFLGVPAQGNRWAALNSAARRAKGNYLLLLDPSAAPLTEGFLDELLMYAQRDDVGAVTPLMWDRRGRITHAGFAVGMRGGALCREEGSNREIFGWHSMLKKSHNVAAVSAACALIRRDHFLPFDERFSGGLCAVEWCIRLQKAGLRHVYTPHAAAQCENRQLLLLGRRRNARDLSMLASLHGGALHDPCYSPLFSRSKADGRIRRR